MTAEEQAEESLRALVGIRLCPWCKTPLYQNYEWPLILNDRPKYCCPNQGCNACCFDHNAVPLDCRKYFDHIDG